jgi:predicted methyltransferase
MICPKKIGTYLKQHTGVFYLMILTNEQEVKSVGLVSPNTLVHGDCLEVMKYIPDGSVDMVLCDLPYG